MLIHYFEAINAAFPTTNGKRNFITFDGTFIIIGIWYNDTCQSFSIEDESELNDPDTVISEIKTFLANAHIDTLTQGE